MNRTLPLALLVALSPLACKKAPVDTTPAWTPQLTAALGASACNPDGTACAPVAPGGALAGKRVTTAPDGSASVTLDHETRLEIGAGATVTFVPGARRTIEVTAGVAEVLRMPSAGTPEAAPIAVKIGDELATLDDKAPTTLVVRVRTAGRAVASVDRGVATFRRGEASPIELHAGETAAIAEGQPIDRRAGYAGEIARVEVPKPVTTPPKGPTRGLGTITARVPGTSEVVSGVRLASHKVHTVVRNGFARTEVEEELANDDARVLEGRFVFPVPPRATIARLALWVGDKLVEDEVVPRAKAAAVFKGIVDDTVRPRDPALLEWVASGEVSLKIFPMPAKGTRKVVLAYDEALPTTGGDVRWVYPLSLGEGRENRIPSLSIAVDVEGGGMEVATPGRTLGATLDERGAHVSYEAKDVTPTSDFVVTWREKAPAPLETAAYVPSWGAPTGLGLERLAKAIGDGSWVALRLTAGLPGDAQPPAFTKKDRVLIVDRSFSQSRETLDGAMRVAAGLARALDPDERFAVLACDSGCESFPDTGLAPATEASFQALEKWAKGVAPGGSSDVAGAMLAGASRVEANGAAQMVYLGDGAPTSGELSATTIATRAQRTLSAKKIDLRLVGSGVTVDAASLDALGSALSATVEPLTTGDALDARIDRLAGDLRHPVIHGAKVELPKTITEVYPATLPALRLGQQVLLVGKLERPEGGEVVLTGELDGKPYSFKATPTWGSGPGAQTALVPRLWASRRIDALRTSGDATAAKEIVDLSQRFHVLTPLTSLLVLENDAMFAEMGIARTVPRGDAAGRAGPQGAQALADAGQLQSLASLGAAPGANQASALDSVAKSDQGLSPGSSGGLSGIGGPSGSIGAGSTSGVSSVVQAPRGNVSVGAPNVTVPIANAARVLAGARPRMRACYQQGLAADPTQEGRISLTIRVGANGDVTAVTGSSSGSISSSVLQCVQARARSLQFEPPEGAGSMITVAFVFKSEPAPAAPPPQRVDIVGPAFQYIPPQPSATVRPSDDAWRTDGEPAIAKLRDTLAKTPTSRQKLEALVRGLLVRGRFDLAMTEAKRFAESDPDLAVARDLLAYASAATGDARGALSAVDAAVETDARSVKGHLRAAHAFEASGDERRACAHWRSLAELTRDDAYQAESLRCRARSLGDRDAAIADARAIEKPGAKVAKIVAAIESPPAFAGDAGGPGQIEITVECTGGECPMPVVVAPNGTVFSPSTPADARATPRSVAFSGLRDGTYRVLLVGGAEGARGDVTIRALGSTQKIAFTRGGLQSVAAAQVSVPPQCCWGIGLADIGRIGGVWLLTLALRFGDDHSAPRMMPVPADTKRALHALVPWLGRVARDLPWRTDRTAYRVWISEVMLQQTRVSTVIPYYDRFLARFPTVTALAAADEGDVLAAWSGLGYYRRARQLHRGARHVAEKLDGEIPGTIEGLLSIPGVGPYTAGAIGSLAFGLRAPLVDGNVVRVLSRIFAIDDDARRPATVKRIWALAGELVPDDAPGAFNEALMELGATVCTPQSPDCSVCPVASACIGRARGIERSLPVLSAKKSVPTVYAAALLARKNGTVLLGRRRGDALFGGMWEPPMTESTERDVATEDAARFATGTEDRGTVNHVLSHRRMEITVLAGSPKARARYPEIYDEVRFVAEADLASYGISTLARKVMKAG